MAEGCKMKHHGNALSIPVSEECGKLEGVTGHHEQLINAGLHRICFLK